MGVHTALDSLGDVVVVSGPKLRKDHPELFGPSCRPGRMRSRPFREVVEHRGLIVNISRRWFGAVGATVTLLATAACGGYTPPPEVSEAQLVGRWHGNCGAAIDLSEDHTFAVKDFPVDFKGVGAKPNPVTGSGEWVLIRAVRDVRPQVLELRLRGRIYELTLGGNKESRKLLWESGDPVYSYTCEFDGTPVE
ncbi:hypothetical protein [Streptomyces sp. NPDC059176]|uniref:hypothetical protein n=1 Tax=Streptomyces sp. NPDC059176 TaxID=3346758 RepID=UPI00369FF219